MSTENFVFSYILFLNHSSFYYYLQPYNFAVIRKALSEKSAWSYWGILATKTIGELKRKIIQTTNELSALSNDQNPIPELINSTNLLRANDFLTKTGDKKSELLTVYDQYAKQLENTLAKIIKIQEQLKKLAKKKSQRKPIRKKTKKKKSAKRRKSSKRKR